jgi:hypothetical protein
MKYNLPNHFDIKALLLMSLDLTNYDIDNWESLDLQTKINHARTIFESEMISNGGYRIKSKYGEEINYRKALKDWLQGLCSVFPVPFWNDDIENWFAVTINRTYRAKEFSKWLERYWDRLAIWLEQLFYFNDWTRKHNGRDLLTMDFDKEIKIIEEKIANLIEEKKNSHHK